MKQKSRQLTRQELAAMWLYGKEYAWSGLGAIEFYKKLPTYKKRIVDRMICEIANAPRVAKRIRRNQKR